MSIDSEKKQLSEQDLIQYGEKAKPIMELLPNKLTGFVSAMLCTPEGFNVCSMGFRSEDIAKMAAVSSSLYAMAGSVLSAFAGKNNSPIETISIYGAHLDVLGKKIELSSGQVLILIIATNKAQAGLQHYAAQFIEEQLQTTLGVTDC